MSWARDGRLDWRKGLLVATMAAVLAACADKPDEDKKPEDKPPPPPKVKTENLICPQVAILRAAQESDGKLSKAFMNGIEGDCGYRDDGIDIKFTLHMEARRDKTGESLKADFPFWVALVDPNETILSRQTLSATFKFSSDDKTAPSDQDLHVFIPLPKKAQMAGPDYRVLTGFPRR